MNLDLRDALGIMIAALGGAAVGLERQWSGHASGVKARFAGIRTFTLLGLTAGLAGWLWSAGLIAFATVKNQVVGFNETPSKALEQKEARNMLRNAV